MPLMLFAAMPPLVAGLFTPLRVIDLMMLIAYAAIAMICRRRLRC